MDGKHLNMKIENGLKAIFENVHSSFEVVAANIVGAISPDGASPNYALDVNKLNFDLMELCTYEKRIS
ncbi:MAG: hypothetical protein AABX04_03255 [Nanoarchaeota archaeon]